jgi:hypothetical protein
MTYLSFFWCIFLRPQIAEILITKIQSHRRSSILNNSKQNVLICEIRAICGRRTSACLADDLSIFFLVHFFAPTDLTDRKDFSSVIFKVLTGTGILNNSKQN